MKPAHRLAYCSIAAALGIVLMLLGAAIGIGTYAAPMFVGLCLEIIGKACGVKYQLMVWIAISLLCLMLCPDIEQNVMFLCFFGWYPALYPKLQKLPQPLRLIVKLLLFNGIILSVEAILLIFFFPEETGLGLIIGTIVLFNLCFLIYDPLIPRFHLLEEMFLKRITHRRP